MRMEFAFFAAAGGVFDGGLQDFELVDVTFEAYPKDVRIARGREAAEAVRAGVDYIVVGRPILEAKDPVGAARAIVAEMETRR